MKLTLIVLTVLLAGCNERYTYTAPQCNKAADPTVVVHLSFGDSDTYGVYQVTDELAAKGWTSISTGTWVVTANCRLSDRWGGA